MALEGNVKDFGLSEILQLIALQKKTGMLSITGERTMVIYFREGLVISTRDRRSQPDDPLRDFLLSYGYIRAEDMERIAGILADTQLDLTDILVSEKLFSTSELRTIFSAQIQETIQEILSWPKSQYKFISGTQVLAGVRSFASLKVEGLLMESMRRIDEFPELVRLFPSEATILKRVPMPETNAPELDEQEAFVYRLLADEHILGTVVSKARMARFTTYETLKCLLEKELIQVMKVEEREGEETPFEVEEMRRGRSLARFAPAVYAAAILVACAALGEFAVPFVLRPGWSLTCRPAARSAASVDRGSTAQSLREIEARRTEAAVREALEEHRALKGSYPASLAGLASRRLIPPAVLSAAAEEGLLYRLTGGGASFSLERRRP